MSSQVFGAMGGWVGWWVDGFSRELMTPGVVGARVCVRDGDGGVG